MEPSGIPEQAQAGQGIMKLKSADINHQITMKPARLLLLLLFIVGYQYVFSRRHILKLDVSMKSYELDLYHWKFFLPEVSVDFLLIDMHFHGLVVFGQIIPLSNKTWK